MAALLCAALLLAGTCCCCTAGGEVKLRDVDVARLSRLRSTCRELGNSSSEQPAHSNEKLLKHLIVDEKREIAFCYVPKVACSHWKRVFLMTTQDGAAEVYTDVADIPASVVHRYQSLDLLHKYVPEDVHLVLNTYKKILFVRHPFERLLSAYRSKFMANNMNTHIKRTYGTKIIAKYRDNPSRMSLRKGHDVTFEEFAKYVSSLKPGQFEHHWDTVNELCQPCLVNYDFVGKLESMRQDSDFVLTNFINDSRVTRFPSKYEHEEVRVEDYFSSLSVDLLQRLYDIYEVDFRLFGYQL